MLEIQNLAVEVDNRKILHNVNLKIPAGEIHVLFGPNGSGKTTLLGAIMGFPRYKIVSGNISYNGEDITNLPLHEHATRGLGISFQRPPTIRGVKTRQVAEVAARGECNIEELAKSIEMSPFLDRYLNEGFSGGEIKRAELLQLMAQDPSFILLDEPESGVDLDAMKLIGSTIRKLLGKEAHCAGRRSKSQKSALIITHTGDILSFIHANKGYVLSEGVIRCSGTPLEILEDIKTKGYAECIACRREAGCID